MKVPLIEFRNVTKRFGENTVLDGAELAIYENEITTIIGKSGTGKSVLLKHIIGLLSPDEGTILFRGKPVIGMKKKEWDGYRGQVSYMFQNNALFDSMTVFENIALPLRQKTSLRKKEIEKKVMTRIEQMELSDVVHQYPSALSGGMQKRVALARALVTDPAIVLFDEPTTGQDPVRKNLILSMIARYRKQFGFTAVLISHDVPDIFFISDRILILWEGKIAFNGSYEELTSLGHPLIDEFIRSLDSLHDNVTGLLSKEMLKSRYALTAGGGKSDSSAVAVLFKVHLGTLVDVRGPQAAVAVLKALGEHASRYFGSLGGFSARHHGDEILTILPRMKLREADPLVNDFVEQFRHKTLPDVRALSGAGTGEKVELFLAVGITEGGADNDIEQILEKASSQQRVIATYQCDKEGCYQ